MTRIGDVLKMKHREEKSLLFACSQQREIFPIKMRSPGCCSTGVIMKNLCANYLIKRKLFITFYTISIKNKYEQCIDKL